LLFLFALTALCAQPQQQATLKGVVTDVTGASVRQAEIRVLQADSHLLIAHATSLENGEFVAGPLPAGSYTLTARAPGSASE
jgi:hypothetical protein